MPLRSRLLGPRLAITLVVLAAVPAAVLAQTPAAITDPAAIAVETPSPTPGGVPTPHEIELATKKVQADPNFATERKISTLRWASAEERNKRRLKFPGWLSWLGGLFAFVAQSARVLMWLVIALAAGLIIIYILRLLSRMDGSALRGTKFVAPSHVQDLDIRPESLPPDIGAAVRELWARGEHRGALALLYRGLLSRLVHVYGVPIRDSSTEGDCLVLAARHVSEGRSRYAQRLVRVWQRAVYGGEAIETETVYALCDEFAQTLDRAPDPDIGAARGAPA